MSSEGLKIVHEAEVVVVGGGPAGTASASRLAELGHDVLIIDRADFPRDKVCADVVGPATVEELRRVGLEDALEGGVTAETARYIRDHRKAKAIDVARPGLSTCCIRRSALDASLVDAARSRGVRWLTARARGVKAAGHDKARVIVDLDDDAAVISARRVVAADGVDSSIRRGFGLRAPRRSAAVYGRRQYFRCQHSLEPVIELFGPLEFQGYYAPGCCWAVPVSATVLNVGMGVARDLTLASHIPMVQLYDESLDRLMAHLSKRCGRLEPIGGPDGSRFAIGFTAEACQLGHVYFVGDAARMTDPITGEGIAQALIGGRVVGDLVHRELRGGGPARSAGRVLDRCFPRLGQDAGFFSRLAVLGLNRAGGTELGSSKRDRETSMTRRLGAAPGSFDSSWEPTPVGQLMIRLEPALADALNTTYELALDAIDTRFPLFREALAREFVTGPGPLPAALALLTTRSVGGLATREICSLAAGMSLAGAMLPSLAEVIDRPRSVAAQMENAAILLLCDYVQGQALTLLRDLPAKALIGLATSATDVARGLMLQHEDRYDLRRSQARYDLAGDQIVGSGAFQTAYHAAVLSGAPDDIGERLGRFARTAARALMIAADIEAFLNGSAVTGRSPTFATGLGFYPLPVLLAADSRRVRRLITRGSRGRADEITTAVVRAGGVDRARQLCHDHARAATLDLESIPLQQPQLLQELVDLSVTWGGAGPAAGPGGQQ